MKKGIAIVLAGLLTLSTMCFADTGTGGASFTEYSVYFRNNTGHYADYLVPTTTIRPNVDKITGYDFKTLAISPEYTETWVSIFDSTSSTMTGECYGEKEANGYESIHDNWPRGRKVLNGVALRVGAFTEGIIKFRRD